MGVWAHDFYEKINEIVTDAVGLKFAVGFEIEAEDPAHFLHYIHDWLLAN